MNILGFRGQPQKTKLPDISLLRKAALACLGLVHGDDPERCYGQGGGRGVHVWERMYTRGGVMSMYGKTNTVLQSKIK